MNSGLILIAIGVLWLLSNFGILPADFWHNIVPWWPLILVVLGLKAIFLPRRKTSMVAIILLLMLLGAFSLFFFQVHEERKDSSVTLIAPMPVGVTMPRESPLVGFKANIAASHFVLRAGDPAMPNLAKTLSRGLPLRQTVGAWGAEYEVIELTHLHQQMRGKNLGQLGSEVVTELNPLQKFTLDVHASAAAVDLDLRGLNLDQLSLRLDAGQATVRLPERPQNLSVVVAANAADVKIVIPENVAARIRISSEAALVSIDESRFQRQGEFFVSRDYDQAAHRLSISAELAVGRLRIE